jgi:predicted GNAT family N-acyltransferase
MSHDSTPDLSGFFIRQVTWQDAELELRTVREQVFMIEQGVPEALEWDGLDAECVHLLARDSEGCAIATARLLPDCHLGRMAVLKSCRGRGLGSALLREMLAIAGQRGCTCIVLNAQTYAIGFYERYGFQRVGDEFMDAGIPHQCMEREL